MGRWTDMVELARLLELEWRGGRIDRARTARLAESLLPAHPEIKHTLKSVQSRMTRRD